jgi:hypothetical protein
VTVLEKGRALAEARMDAECVIAGRLGPEDTFPATDTFPPDDVFPEGRRWNPDTLQYEHVPYVSYEGRCRVRPTGQQDRGTDAADQLFVESSYTLSLPVVGSEGVRRDHMVKVTACPDDPALVGKVFSILAVPAYSGGTARRVRVVEAS